MKDLPSLLIFMRIIPRLQAKVVTRCKGKIISLDKSSSVIRYVDGESPRCVLGTNVHIPFDAHPCNVIFLASLDGMGFYNMDDDSLGFCSTPRFLIYSPYDIGIYNWSVGTFCANSLYFVLIKFWCMGNTAVLRLDVDLKAIKNVGFRIQLSVKSIGHVDVQLWRMQNETWSKVVSFVPRVFMPLMIGSYVHYIDGNNKLIIVHE
ncbi:hypothetical protein Hanom_Chr15g01377781 [Helianthus anomalus]